MLTALDRAHKALSHISEESDYTFHGKCDVVADAIRQACAEERERTLRECVQMAEDQGAAAENEQGYYGHAAHTADRIADAFRALLPEEARNA